MRARRLAGDTLHSSEGATRPRRKTTQRQLTMDTIYQRMTAVLKDKGVPVREMRRTLSTVCGVSYQAVSGWELYPDREIGIEKIDLFAERYRINFRWLATGKGHPNDSNASDALGYATYSRMREVADRSAAILALLQQQADDLGALSQTEQSLIERFRGFSPEVQANALSILKAMRPE